MARVTKKWINMRTYREFLYKKVEFIRNSTKLPTKRADDEGLMYNCKIHVYSCLANLISASRKIWSNLVGFYLNTLLYYYYSFSVFCLPEQNAKMSCFVRSSTYFLVPASFFFTYPHLVNLKLFVWLTIMGLITPSSSVGEKCFWFASHFCLFRMQAE